MLIEKKRKKKKEKNYENKINLMINMDNFLFYFKGWLREVAGRVEIVRDY